VGGPVDSEEGGRAVDAMAVHELDDGVVREPAGGSLAAPDDRGELDRLIPFRVERELLVALGDHPPALERHEAASAEVENVGQQPFDPLAGVDGDGDDWQVLGECEQAVGLERLPGAEALDAAQNDAGEDVVVGVMDNPADVPHNVALEGGGIDEKGEVVGKRGTSRVSAQVKPGNYTFYCSVPGHREGGMEGTLTVK
jgi:hypothetical protein